MKVSVEELSTTRRKVAVELDPSDVEEQVERSYRELARSVQLKGFRPGRAPRTLLKQLYGKEIDAEVTGKLIEETIPKALEDNKLEPVAMPVIEERELADDRSFRYTALVEVQPEIELKDYRGIAVTGEKVEVASADVDRTIEQIRTSRSTLVDRDTEARRGDVLVADWDMEVEGKEGSQASRQDATLELADGSLLPELVAGLEGAKAGDVRTVTANLGERAPDPSLVGKTATFKVTVKKVQERVLPALDDELAKQVSGLDTVDALKADVESKIRERLEREVRAKQHEQIVDTLVEANPFDAPETLVEQAVRNLTRFSGADVPEGESEEARDERKAAIEKAAKRQVCGDLLLRRIADKEDISVSDEDVDAELDERARAIGQDGRVLRAAYEKKGILDEIRGDLRRRRTLDFLLENAKISG